MCIEQIHRSRINMLGNESRCTHKSHHRVEREGRMMSAEQSGDGPQAWSSGMVLTYATIN